MAQKITSLDCETGRVKAKITVVTTGLTRPMAEMESTVLDVEDAPPASRRGRRRLSLDHLPLTPTVPAVGQTLQDAVYQQLRSALMVGAFRPGESLSVPAIAASLGTSGAPVKDALRRLVAEGAFHVLPQSSYVVETLTASRFLDLTEARIRLETLAATRTAELAPRSLIRTLTALNERYRRPPSTIAVRGNLLQANYDFHFAIYGASQMPDVCEIILSAWLRTGPLFSLIETDLDPEDDYQRHAAIIKAIAAKDPAQTAIALEADIRKTAIRIAPHLPA